MVLSEKDDDTKISMKKEACSVQFFLDHFLFFLFILFYSIVYFNNRQLFLNFTFYLSLMLSIYKFILLIKYHDIVYYCLKIISILLAINILIKNHNPFFNSLFFWLPFQDLFRGLMIIKIMNYFFEQDYISLTIEEKQGLNKSFFSKFISYQIFHCYFNLLFVIITKKKKMLISLVFILISIKLIIFAITDNIPPPYFKNKIREKKYFIAANLFNNVNIMDDWTSELIKLVEYLGRENVYISILENGDSTDGTIEKLKQFETQLNEMNVSNKIITDQIYTKASMLRIDFLVELRNRVLEPMHSQIDWEFDDFMIIFFNDILYKYTDILNLIMTNNLNYDIACGLDFYTKFYDQWVSRDLDGNRFRSFFPFFIDKHSQDRVINGEPVRVFACWNGVAVLNPKPFQYIGKLKFRGNKSIWESECFLICKDYWIVGFNRILLNPNVKVTYDYMDYYMVRYVDPIVKIHAYFYYYFNFFFDYNPFTGDLDTHNIKMRRDWKFFV